MLGLVKYSTVPAPQSEHSNGEGDVGDGGVGLAAIEGRFAVLGAVVAVRAADLVQIAHRARAQQIEHAGGREAGEAGTTNDVRNDV